MEVDLETWRERYSTKEFIDLKKYLNSFDIELLKKLGIEVQDKLYTEREFDVLDDRLFLYYVSEETTEDELELILPLEGTGVSRKEYNRLVDIFTKIESDYGI